MDYLFELVIHLKVSPKEDNILPNNFGPLTIPTIIETISTITDKRIVKPHSSELVSHIMAAVAGNTQINAKAQAKSIPNKHPKNPPATLTRQGSSSRSSIMVVLDGVSSKGVP